MKTYVPEAPGDSCAGGMLFVHWNRFIWCISYLTGIVSCEEHHVWDFSIYYISAIGFTVKAIVQLLLDYSMKYEEHTIDHRLPINRYI